MASIGRTRRLVKSYQKPHCGILPKPIIYLRRIGREVFSTL